MDVRRLYIQKHWRTDIRQFGVRDPCPNALVILIKVTGLPTQMLKFGGKAFEIVFGKGSLIFAIPLFKQIVVVFPELILFGCAFAGCAGPCGFLT